MILFRHRQFAPSTRAFTLVELLVVLLIIGLISALSLPALKGIGQSNTMTSATRQLLDDLSLARHKAISGRTTVHVLFVPDFELYSEYEAPANPADLALFKRLRAGCQTTYALYSQRTAGDQPGRWTDRYLTKWRSLPEGVFIASHEFGVDANALDRPFRFTALPFPAVGRMNKQDQVCYVAFNQHGSLVDALGQPVLEDEYIWLTKGSILPIYDPTSGDVTDLDVREIPPGNWTTNYNRIHIDAITGRAKLERPEISNIP